MLATNPIDELKKRFRPEAATNVCATYLLQITGEGGGAWFIKINSGNMELIPYEQNSAIKPDCSIAVSVDDLQMIMSGKLSAMTAALSGMLSIDGELGLAMQLVPVFFDGQSAHIF